MSIIKIKSSCPTDIKNIWNINREVANRKLKTKNIHSKIIHNNMLIDINNNYKYVNMFYM